MSSHPGYGRMRVVAEARREPVIPSGVLGMLIFVFTEAMLFAGLISAFTIIKASAIIWPPPGQPRLPIEETAVNTAALIGSGLLLHLARRRFNESRSAALKPMLFAILLATFFVVFQGAEWVALIGQGLTLTSSAMGSFFYLIVGLHALHAVVAIFLLAQTYRRLRSGFLASSQLAATEVFWYFVVGLWPILYAVVYL